MDFNLIAQPQIFWYKEEHEKIYNVKLVFVQKYFYSLRFSS